MENTTRIPNDQYVYNDAELCLIDILRQNGVPDKEMTVGDIREFGLTGNENLKDIEGYANDFLCERHTEMCYAKHAWKYEEL